MDKMLLGVNVDHVATVRQQRRGREPDPVAAALEAESAGADSIVCHLREDRRHIQDRDLELLRRLVKTRLNLEMAATGEMIEIALRAGPDQVTLVPEKREELTTEGGLDVRGNSRALSRAAARFREAEITVSFFIDPDFDQVEASVAAGAQVVEIHTGNYAEAGDHRAREAELRKITAAAEAAAGLGLVAVAGHGLDYRNVSPVASIKEIIELNIGFSIIARALSVGLEAAVREMRLRIDEARRSARNGSR